MRCHRSRSSNTWIWRYAQWSCRFSSATSGESSGAGLGGLGIATGKNNYRWLCFSSHEKSFPKQRDCSPRPAHSLVTEAPPSVAPKISPFGLRLEKLLIPPAGKLEIAIDLAAAEQQVQQSLALGIGRRPERAGLHRLPLHAIPPAKTVVARDDLAASFSSASPTTFRNHARSLLPASSMPPNSRANSSWLSTTLFSPASACGHRKRPFSKRLAQTHSPLLSQNNNFSRFRCALENRKRWPLSGSNCNRSRARP